MIFSAIVRPAPFLLFCLCVLNGLHASAVTANAGNDTQICPAASVTLGGAPTASGGTAPYSYSWYPTTGLSSGTSSNPLAFPSVPTWYQLIVTDANGNKDTDFVHVDINPVYQYNAGRDTSICMGASLTLGAAANSTNGGASFSWSPNVFLDNPNSPRPIFTPTGPTTINYTVTITSSCPTKFYTINVVVHPLPTIDAGSNVTINEGETTTLNATGGSSYAWSPNYNIRYQNTPNPDVEPVYTTTYYVQSLDAYGCYGFDSVTVYVNPSNELVFYNTFTPNNDGDNDTWYIGNIQKYPKNRLEIYNRNGQLVYAKASYLNEWNGTNFGDALPSATYYFILDLGTGEKVHGSVTIVR